MTPPEERCHCGRLLHYSDAGIRAYVEDMIARLGPTVPVKNAAGRSFLVPRHFIALHGLKEAELATLGFPELP